MKTELYCEILVKALKAALLFSGDKDIRGYFNGVCIEWGPKGTKLIATDGHRLLCHLVSSEATDKPAHFVIPNESLEAALKMSGKLTALAFVYSQESHPDPERPGVTVVKMPSITITGGITAECLQEKFGRFPNIDRAVPKTCNAEIAQFDMGLLGDLGKATKILTNSLYVNIAHNGQGPALAVIDEQTFAVIMPIRGEAQENIKLPAWAL